MAGRDLPVSAMMDATMMEPVSNVMPDHNGVRLLKMIQARHPNYHPALAISDLAHTAEGDDLKFRCHSTLLKYVEPELRSVQIQADVKETRTIRVSLFEPLEHELSDTEANKIKEALSHAPRMPAIIDVSSIEDTPERDAVKTETKDK